MTDKLTAEQIAQLSDRELSWRIAKMLGWRVEENCEGGIFYLFHNSEKVLCSVGGGGYPSANQALQYAPQYASDGNFMLELIGTVPIDKWHINMRTDKYGGTNIWIQLWNLPDIDTSEATLFSSYAPIFSRSFAEVWLQWAQEYLWRELDWLEECKTIIHMFRRTGICYTASLKERKAALNRLKTLVDIYIRNGHE